MALTREAPGAQTISKRDALALRYGKASIPKAGPWNDVIASLLDHRSVRGYKTDPVPAGTLETMVAAAQSAATSSNLQTWSVVAISDPAMRAEFAKIANNQKHIEQCPLFMCWIADVSRLERVGSQEKVELASTPYLETFLVAAIDAALAAQNAVVAAESLGLKTVYIGAMRNNIERVAEMLKLPPGAVCVFGLCVGHPLPEVTNAVKARLPQTAILHHNHYDASREQAIRAAYDQELAAYSKTHEMSMYTWTERVVSRVQKISAMSGRHTLKEALGRIGFPLK